MIRNQSPKFHASFWRVTLKVGEKYLGVYGNGSTEAEAMKDFQNKIAGKVLAIDNREMTF